MNKADQTQLFDLDSLSIASLPDVSDTLFLEDQTTQAVGEKFIVFLINEKHYAIKASEVIEVVRPLSYTTLPNVPQWLLGIANLRGDIISIIDLQILFKLESSDSSKTKLIVLRSSDSDSHLAFKVDKVREILTLPDEDIKSNQEDSNSFSSGMIEHKSNQINILNVKKILAALIVN